MSPLLRGGLLGAPGWGRGPGQPCRLPLPAAAPAFAPAPAGWQRGSGQNRLNPCGACLSHAQRFRESLPCALHGLRWSRSFPRRGPGPDGQQRPRGEGGRRGPGPAPLPQTFVVLRQGALPLFAYSLRIRPACGQGRCDHSYHSYK